jgi:hypothetical protein
MWAQRKLTSYEDKKRALLKKGFTFSEACRMATNLEVVYG